MQLAAFIIAIMSVLVSAVAIVYAHRADRRAEAAERRVTHVATLEEMIGMVIEIGRAEADDRLAKRFRAQLGAALEAWPPGTFPASQAIADDAATRSHAEAIRELQRAIVRENAQLSSE